MAQTGGVRLVQVHPHDPDTETDIDIIAIHGLDTKSPDTWIWKSNTSEQPNVNWLVDSRMLPSKVGPARIFTCDWPANVLLQSDSIPMVLREFARLLLAGINSRPLETNGQAREDRPILFIASCLGGIILMQALVMADHDYLSLRRATRGIVFLATPFRGTSFQDVANWAEPGLRAWASARGQEVTKLLDNVKGPTFDLNELVRSFTQLCLNGSYPCQTLTFYELGKTRLHRKCPLAGLIPPQLLDLFVQPKPLVDRFSATLDIDPHPLPLDRPHVAMNKFDGPADQGYLLVAAKIQDILCGIRDGSPLEKADAWIRVNHYTADTLKIERLSGIGLPMDQCYINLAIVEQLEEVETPNETIQVELRTIFNPREGPDGNTTQPRRILIQGCAGVGKTTLCKKIVHDFTHHGLWRDLFDRLLWVPLRRLKGRGDARYNLEELFYDEYFSQHVEGRRLAKALRRTLDINRGRTLFVLDGLDELSQNLSSDDNMFSFLQQLLNQPDVIITSRPYGNAPAGLQNLDLELETIGFYPDQVKDYLEKAFVDPNRVDEVQSFLQRHWLIQGLVRIPIQLDALCFTWDDSGFESIPQTMTTVYKAIEQRLWKKDILRLGKKSDSYVRTSCPSEIERTIEAETALLGCLAFTGLHNDVIDFTPEHRDSVSDLLKLESDLSLDETLARLSFLRTSDRSLEGPNRNYHFLHLTFQEYFAALYFVRQWKARQPLKCLVLSNRKIEETEPTRFLQQHKYSARYDVFWRFVAGLLDAEGQASPFFNKIEDEPRDLLGPTHQRVVMHCLSEISMETPIRTNLEKKLSQWLLFECTFTKRSRLGSEAECPEKVLNTALQEDAQKEIILTSLTTRTRIPSSIIKLAASWLRNDISRNLKSVVCWMLQSSGESLPKDALEDVAARLNDEDSHVRKVAVQALGCQSTLPEEILQAVVARLKDEDSNVRRAAIEVLGRQSVVPEEILQAVAAQLKDKDSYVRSAAVEALQRQSALPEEVLQAIAARLKEGEGESSNVRRAAIEVLGRQSALPEEILRTVAAQLQDKDSDVRRAAIEVLGRQSVVPEEILLALAARLEDEDWYVRRTAIQALSRESAFQEEVLRALAARLEDENSYVRRAAVQAVGRQSALLGKIHQAIAVQLKDKNLFVRQGDVEALGRQSALLLEILHAVAARLKDEESYVRDAAVGALDRQLALLREIFQDIASLLESERSSDLVDAILKRHREFCSTLSHRQYVKSSYEMLLRRSFNEYLSWTVEDGWSCVNMPEGVIRRHIGNQQDFRTMVNEARPTDCPSDCPSMDDEVGNGG